MRTVVTHERVLLGMAMVMVVLTVAIGMRTSKADDGIDLNRSHMLVFEASRQLSDFDRLRYVANQVILDDPTLRPRDFDRAFAMTTSRMRNFRQGGAVSTDDAQARAHIDDLIALHDQMLAIAGDPSCDARCLAEAVASPIRKAKRVLMKLQGRALAADGNMRGLMQSLHRTAVYRIFTVAFLLVIVLIALVAYMARKNATLRHQAADLRASHHRIAEVSEYRARFLAGMSHEFRTPLNAIKGFSQMMLLMRERVSEEKVRDYLVAIEKSARDLEALTDTVLDLAKVDAGAIVLEEDAVDLVATVLEVNEQFRAGGTLSAHRLSIDLPPALTMTGDRAALKRCVQNLVSNALKFSSAETTVSVRIWQRADGAACLSVRDRGCGIPEGEVDLVWGVYARSSYTRVSDKQGTGLGLPIVRALMQAHGGDATLESRSGEGTTVTLTIPAFRVSAAAPAARAA